VPGSLIPLFPLKVVLFPRTPLPLHIFEERYKEMINDVLQASSEFGVVQGNEEGIVTTGCTAQVDRVLRRYEDGRLDVLCVGRRRFEVMLLDQERSYLRAEVQFFDDESEEEVPTNLREEALVTFKLLRESSDIQVIGEPSDSDPRLSFQLAQLIPDLHFRQVLLGTRSESERLKQFNAYAPRHIAEQRQTAHVRKVAPTNGLGRKLTS
jgi:ATP-dependent Lon protease